MHDTGSSTHINHTACSCDRLYFSKGCKNLPTVSRKVTLVRHKDFSPVQVRRPEIRVYSNVDGKRYMNENHVRRQLVKQLVSPVKWEQTLHEIYERTQGEKFPCTYEVGPGKQLGATLQRCNRKAFTAYARVDVTAYED